MRQARLAVHDEGLAEDLVQDTLIAVVQQAHQHRGDASLTTWATAILKHKVADWYRSPVRRRFEPLTEAASPSGDDMLFDDESRFTEAVPAWQQPENQVEQRQMMTTLEGCVRCLSPRSGRVFMMREWLGLETAEICNQLGLTAENCRMMLHRARAALRTCMQRHWIESEGHA
jgi:RNA polymerase sigma-70 factor (ECF subfamily)